MKLIPMFRFPTSAGHVVIAMSAPDRRFHVLWKEDSLGSYPTAAAAADDAAGGHTFTPSDGTDLGELGISPGLGVWERVAPPGQR
jgi:hypothetical protein